MNVGRELAERVREIAGHRCGYCLSPQRLVLGWLEVEHVIPRAKGGSSEEENLWLACRLCNNYKGAQVDAIDPATGERIRLFHPRHDGWWHHFRWIEGGLRIEGKTPQGRATEIALNLNNPIAMMVRREWIQAGWHPPTA